jgi:uncharacterized repeat protein (TIGR01451 family)
MKRAIVAAASALAIVFAGSAASGVSSSDAPAPKSPKADAASVVEDGIRRAPAPLSERGESALRKAGLLRTRKGDRTRVNSPAPTDERATTASAEPTSASSAEPATTSDAGTAETQSSTAEPRQVKKAQAAEGGFFPGLPATEHAGYASGSVIHADALQSGGNRIVNADVAFSGASFSSADLTGDIKNEMARLVGPKLAAGNAFGRGSGLEAGLVIGESAENQVILPAQVQAKAPPSTPLVTKTLLDQNIDPLAAAAVLKGEAKALGGAACTTGVDLSYGLGHVADLSLVKAAADGFLVNTEVPEGATDAVSQTRSATRLVAQSGTDGPIQKLGLQSEVRQTIAPVTLFGGTDQQFTINLLGEWVLRATADGKEGSVFYGPGTVEPETPILQVLDAGGEIMNQITAQDFFGSEGLVIEVPQVAQIAIGEDPRAIGGNVSSKPVETATAASGAVDVVRVTLLDAGDTRGADLRIGHLEAAVAVPEGGITCGIGLTKTAMPEAVSVGQPFKWNIKVTNPNDCTLTNVKVVDTISVNGPVTYSVKGATPKADSQSNTEVVWNDVGPIESGQSKDLSIDMLVNQDSGAGNFIDNVVATGQCGPVPLEGEGQAGAGATGVSIPLRAEARLELPEVVAVLAAPAEVPLLPRTGKDALNLIGLAMVGVGGGMFLKAASRFRRKG